MCKVKRQPDEMMSKTRKHLYIIFDDWESGFSIRKIDLDTDQLIPGGYKAREVALPPPSIRFRAECSYPIYFSDAIGSKILAMHPKKENNADRGAFCFDVHNRRLNCIPRHTDQFRPIYFPIGNRLFALGNFSLEILDLQPLVSRSSQLDALSWHKLKDVPVDSMFVISHAVLPDSQTIFVSVGITTHTTHSLHMGEDGSFKWTNHGEWILPFDGCGFFDPKLNTWVGLALYKEKPGRICSCNLASVTSKVRPDVKYTEECLFSADPAETNVGATLVYMGHSSKYCLVECIEVGNKDKAPCMFLRLTMFSLRCNESEVLTLGDSRRVRYIKLPKKEISESLFLRPQAFWL